MCRQYFERGRWQYVWCARLFYTFAGREGGRVNIVSGIVRSCDKLICKLLAVCLHVSTSVCLPCFHSVSTHPYPSPRLFKARLSDGSLALVAKNPVSICAASSQACQSHGLSCSSGSTDWNRLKLYQNCSVFIQVFGTAEQSPVFPAPATLCKPERERAAASVTQ